MDDDTGGARAYGICEPDNGGERLLGLYAAATAKGSSSQREESL